MHIYAIDKERRFIMRIMTKAMNRFTRRYPKTSMCTLLGSFGTVIQACIGLRSSDILHDSKYENDSSMALN